MPADREDDFGQERGEAAHQCVASWSACACAWPSVEVRIAGRRDALEPHEQPPDVVAHRPEEAFRIDAHPQHRERDRREQPPFARG